jgi:hypothetical protein
MVSEIRGRGSEAIDKALALLNPASNLGYEKQPTSNELGSKDHQVPTANDISKKDTNDYEIRIAMYLAAGAAAAYVASRMMVAAAGSQSKAIGTLQC